MPTRTPLATPAVPAPKAEVRQAPPGRPASLRAPVTVITPVGEFELAQGSLLIGRLPECDVVLSDPLVSRMHARLSVQGSDIVLEDLHSTNGVFVNGLKVSHGQALCEGARILVGTSELSLFQVRPSSSIHTRPTSAPSARLDQEPTLPPQPNPQKRQLAGINLKAVRAPGPPPVPQPPQQAAPPLPPEAGAIPTTERADALEMLGSLAERLAELGKFEQAAEALSGHLRRILKGANSGLVVTPEVARSASMYALKLARWTRLPLWADYAVELHLSARLPMALATVQAYEVAIAGLEFDRLLLIYYVESLAPRLEAMSPAERLRVEHLATLARSTRS